METIESASSMSSTQAVDDIVKDIQVAINNRFQVLQYSLTATIDEKIKNNTIPIMGLPLLMQYLLVLKTRQIFVNS
jgi:hypothetical protein